MSTYEFDKSVCLYYENDSHRGPGKVVQNLTKGLETIGIEVNSVYSSRPSEYRGCLQNCEHELLIQHYQNNEPVLLGPNLFVLPTDSPELCNMFSDFVVPSKWVQDKYYSFDLMKEKNIHIWPVGIDTQKWSPISPSPPWKELDCFIYFKNRSEKDLQIVEALCKKNNLKYEVIKYGSYKEDDLYSLCQIIHANNGFVILLNSTESQGIAYMQILSFNIPCYVFDNPIWKSNDGKIQVPATSVPYFDERCGSMTTNIDLEHFSKFVNNARQQRFSPREYILENHTLEKSAQKYFDLLKTSCS